MKRALVGWLVLGGWCGGLFQGQAAGAASAALEPAIYYGTEASPLEVLAAREVRRYLYLRTGRLLPLKTVATATGGVAGGIVVGHRHQPCVTGWLSEPANTASLETLEPQQYWLKTVRSGGRSLVLLTGGDDVGALYAAYRFAEHLGVRFYLHGDVVPDRRIELALPMLDERGMPLFHLRGIQPFHDFPEGPDWWNWDEYEAIIAQLPKLRMNFLGLHTYPENAPNAEPTVWIGTADDITERAQVKSSYPASYQNTLRGNWGYAPKKTSDFAFGAAELFEHDAYGPQVMLGYCPQPTSPEDCNVVFEGAGAMLRDAFGWARQLGVRTCVGTETPLTVPKLVADRLKAQGKDPSQPAVLRELYEGIFLRVMKLYELDYYWFWTPEGWTWEGTKEEQIRATTNDLFAALAAAENVGAPFRLATCGWVLGPQKDRAMFDRVLPKEVAVSCINREVGKTPVDRGFAEVTRRSKWAIPWLEDDPALTSPQLWAGRMRRDAADARRYGCDGLMGIHWRTRVLAPAVGALAQAGWDQSEWNPAPYESPAQPEPTLGPTGGQMAAFPDHAIADTEEAPLYQTVRYNVSAYRFPVPDGLCKVTLKFCEPHYTTAGKRVFGVRLQGKRVLDQLDIFAKAGQNRALDYTYDRVTVTNGWLQIDFIPVVEFPSIAALVIEAPGKTIRVNCGGPAYKDYVADWPASGPAEAKFPPILDFYVDWAFHEFGEEIAAEAATLFAKLDGRLPRPSDWVDGPGGIRPDNRPWFEVSREYEFVRELEALRPRVQGAGNQSRFDYWLETFRYMRVMAQVNCTWGAYNEAIRRAKAKASAAEQSELARSLALPLRRQLVREVAEVYDHLLALVSNTGELGTVANWDQHLLPGLLAKPGEELAQLLGEPLPADAQPTKTYRGPTRLIVPTASTCASGRQKLRVKVIVLAEKAPKAASVYWRKLGAQTFDKEPLTHVARGVYLAELYWSPSWWQDLEYYVEVVPASGPSLLYPPTAPAMNQTVVAWPGP